MASTDLSGPAAQRIGTYATSAVPAMTVTGDFIGNVDPSVRLRF